MLRLLRVTITVVAVLLAGLIGLGAVLVIAPPGPELRARVSRIAGEQVPAVIRNLKDAFDAARDLVDPTD